MSTEHLHPDEAHVYRTCACNNCFELVIGPAGTLCDACEKADCDLDGDCQADHCAECMGAAADECSGCEYHLE